MKIRKIVKKDFDKFVELMVEADNRPKDWAKEKTAEFIGKKNKLILVAEEKGKLIGYVGLKERDEDERIKKVDFDKYASVTWIAVLPEFRGKSIGSKLLKSCEKYAKKWGKKGIWLDCRKEVLKFYKRNEYKVVSSFIKEVKTKKRKQYVLLKKIR
jgi:ribosomal-protein-alanine N-acetyltransferase